MNGLRSAIGFLTILPLAPSHANGSMSSARGWFPLVGLMIGAILVGIEFLLLLFLGLPEAGWYGYTSFTAATFSHYTPSTLLWAALIVLTVVVLTRALHLDGFMDSCDALLGGFDRERRLEILRDPHVGAFAVIGVVFLLLIKVVVVADLPVAWLPLMGPNRVAVLLLFPCLSRWAMLLTMELYPYVRRNGLGTAFFSGDKARFSKHLIFGFAFTLAVSVALAGVVGIILLAAASVVAWAVGAWATRLLGGVTGDIYGAVNEMTEVIVLLLAIRLIDSSSFVIQSPLFELFWTAPQ
ncbi:MAG: adenosylcobinamide-GDP ribazoletransferase [Chloroflexota bacterium]|nr:adenosylcobinamide-GDP ribazoletransferase [Chloroflexota bacterium]MDE2686421.1 adenosylcobinamide-GDP ribazoletransferase [Chloroflexota bacterium]